MVNKEITDKLNLVLIKAIKDQDLGIVNQLLDILPINSPIDENGMTVLAFAACYCFNREIVYAITLRNPNVNIVDKYSRTPLMLAVATTIKLTDPQAMQVNLDLVNYLIDAGADRNARSSGGETALTYSIQGGRIKVVGALLNSAFFPEQMNGFGQTILDLARI